MNDLKIRAMVPEDWPQVAEIYGQGVASHKATFATKVPSYAEWDADHMQSCRLVAEHNHCVVGWIALTQSFARGVYSGVAEVSLYVHENYQRQGVGRALLAYLDQESADQGVWTLEALIFDDNAPSLALFRSCGYTDLGVRQRLGYDPSLKCWRNVAMLEKRTKDDRYV